MSNTANLARPYARAIFELATAEKKLPQWNEILEKMAKIVQEPEVAKLLKNPKLTTTQQAEIITALVAEKNSPEKEIKNLIKLLAEKKRLMILPDIAKLFAEYRAESERILNVEVSSVIKLPLDISEKLQHLLNKKLGRNIKIHNKINPNLMGGMLIRAGDLVIDGSVRGELERMRANLIS